jgi:hypothetical protein
MDLPDLSKITLRRREFDDGNSKHPLSPIETNSTNSQADLHSSSDPFSEEDILRLDGRGLCGFFERIPLAFKILAIASISIVGVVVLGALYISDRASIEVTNRAMRNYIDSTVLLNTLAQNLDNEYGIALSALVSPSGSGASRLPQLLSSYALTNESIVAYYTQVVPYIKSLNPPAYTYSDMVDVDTQYAKLNKTRALTLGMNYSDSVTVLKNYNDFVTAVLDLADDLNDLLGVSSLSVTSYIAAFRLVQAMRNIRYMGMIILTQPTFSVANAIKLERWISDYYALDQSLVSVTVGSQLQYYYGLENDNNTIAALEMVEQVRSTYTGVHNVTFAEFVAVTGSWLFVYFGLTDNIRSGIYSDADNSTKKNVGYLFVACFLPVLFFFLTAIITYLLALTITGPWRRLNRIQDLAIKRFVPSSMLAMLKCRTITDVENGIFAVRKLTFVRARIIGSPLIESNTVPDIAVQRLKRVYEYVGPIVRKYNGFVDQYTGDGFIAIFKDKKNGFNACMAIQTAMVTFNRILSNTETHLLTVAHSARVVACAIGEHGRINGAFISNQISIIDEVVKYGLEHTNGNFKILLTKPVMKVVKKGIQSRYIGSTVEDITSKRPSMEMFEVLDGTDIAKLTCRDQFSEGVRLLYAKNYIEGLVNFEACNQDALAAEYAKDCKRRINIAKRLFDDWQIVDTLNETTVVLTAFIEHCQAEKSSENVNMWLEIEEYNHTKEALEREVIAKGIIIKYFSTLNVTESTKNTIVLHLEQQISGESTVDLFKELQSELMVLMKDTHNRFKNKKLLNVLCRL